MNFNFKMKDGRVLRVFWNDLFYDEVKHTHGTVSWFDKFDDGTYKERVRTVRVDDSGREFFTWDKEKIYMDSFLACTPEELVKLYETENDMNIISDDLTATLIKYGVDSLRLMINVVPLTRVDFGGASIAFECRSSLDKDREIPVEYKFIEKDYKLRDNYKYMLVPANDDEYDLYPKKRYYTSDLLGLLSGCRDTHKLKVGKVA